MIAEIIKDKLYLGAYDVSRNKLKKKKIRTRYNISGVSLNKAVVSYPVHHFGTPLEFATAVKILDLLIDSQAPVYIHCLNGANRSPTVCALYLAYKYPKEYPTFVEALNYVTAQRPETYVILENLESAEQALLS